MNLNFRKALISDAPAIFHLINYYAEQGIMLSRLQGEIYEHLRDFSVCADGGRVVGCAALQVYWDDLEPSHFLVPDIEANYPQKDYHRIYYGEIVAVCAA